MNYEKYHVEASDSFLKFQFVSSGPKGDIVKQVIFRQMENEAVYSLAFGDLDEQTGEINDTTVSNNNDSQKVLATVALTLFRFFERYPDKFVGATGSTKSRTRLYQMSISNNFQEICIDFEVFGFAGEHWEGFTKGKNYEAFLVRKIS